MIVETFLEFFLDIKKALLSPTLNCVSTRVSKRNSIAKLIRGFEGLHVRHVFVLVAPRELLQVVQVFRAELVDNSGQQIRKLLRHRVPGNHVRVRRDARLDGRVAVVNHVTVVDEDVNLLHARDGLDAEAFHRALKTLVVV